MSVGPYDRDDILYPDFLFFNDGISIRPAEDSLLDTIYRLSLFTDYYYCIVNLAMILHDHLTLAFDTVLLYNLCGYIAFRVFAFPFFHFRIGRHSLVTIRFFILLMSL